eukprot:TRINITY_DN804_c0_g1_i3.p1 TRINITY_DN804_c0_g1~~TRINITY_DN804_c0_g1_i3.p1  ORF type:complete len:224 (-),score=21.62 TRINITY_DN804_c0_g1_i3:580-1173(-)
MAYQAEKADARKQSWLQHVPTRFHQDGRHFRTEPFTTSASYIAMHRWPQSSANAGLISAMHYARNLAGSGSSSEAQMYGCSCFVKKLKPSTLGCAIVEFASHSMREAVMSRAEQFPIMNGVPRMGIRGVYVNLRRHIDKYGTPLQQEKVMSIFVSWSHGVEKQSPLPPMALVEAFDTLVAQVEAPEPSSLPAPRFVV